MAPPTNTSSLFAVGTIRFRLQTCRRGIDPPDTRSCISQCWCQDSSLNLRHGDGVCDFDCAGDSSIKCGGFDSFSLYDMADADFPLPPSDSNYLGCYADDQRDRVLDDAMITSSAMTSEVCSYGNPREKTQRMRSLDVHIISMYRRCMYLSDIE